MNQKPLSCFLLCIVALLSSCSKSAPPAGQDSSGLKKVELALNWLPEAEHGGFYAALLNGDYKAAGLDVKILPGGPDSPVIQRVGANRVTFGISNADRIALGRAQQAPVVALMAPLQHSPRCIMVHKEAGIDQWDQLSDLTLAMSDAPAFSHFLRSQLPFENIKVVRNSGSIAQFLQDKRFAQQGYVFSEPIVARQQGANPVVLMVSELGFDPYSSVVISHEQTVNDQPELVQKFIEASVSGWKSYLQDSTAVHQHIQKINPEMPREVLDAGWEELKKLCLDDEGRFDGMMQSERWQTMLKQLEEIELLAQDAVSADQIFTNQFLEPVEAVSSDEH